MKAATTTAAVRRANTTDGRLRICIPDLSQPGSLGLVYQPLVRPRPARANLLPAGRFTLLGADGSLLCHLADCNRRPRALGLSPSINGRGVAGGSSSAGADRD